ncbi:MAG: hypothetical protein OXU45_04580 [Candidatus Melainabacteria bacterium]|nr:hypothetical protein [Candidatus Melainabacteria bacterium]
MFRKITILRLALALSFLGQPLMVAASHNGEASHYQAKTKIENSKEKKESSTLETIGKVALVGVAGIGLLGWLILDTYYESTYPDRY